MRRRQILVATLAAVFAAPGWAAAQTAAKVDAIKLASVIRATTAVPLREGAPKQALIYVPEKEVGTVGKGESLEVTDTRLFKNLLGTQKWLQVRRPAGSTPPVGWVYAGNEGGESCCFELQRP